LGLTASPGAERKIVEQIAKNLNIEAIELRTRDSPDVKEYLQELTFDAVRVDFPEDFQKLHALLKKIFMKKIDELRDRKLLFGPPMKKIILETQGKIMKAITAGNKHFNLLMGASACSQAIKVEHALELIETQTLSSVYEYFHTLFQQAKENKSKAVVNLIKQPEFNQAFVLLNELIAKKIEHPKLLKLREIISSGLKENNKNKVMVFCQFRSTAVKIARELNTVQGINAKVFVGQSVNKMKSGEEIGLTQKEQHAMIEEFKEGTVNTLVATSIGEEGLDIPEVNAVIFYEPIPSAIRRIQRAGRTARLMKGNLTILITRDTRDEAYYYAAISREKKMYSAIQMVKDNLDLNKEIEKGITYEKPSEQKKLF
jgi:Fanconi anemia group M protein